MNLVNFAAEAIITGNPNMNLYKPEPMSKMDELIASRLKDPKFVKKEFK